MGSFDCLPNAKKNFEQMLNENSDYKKLYI
ncbi:hypothetical protein VCSRO158_1889 [Vibrio cholerae]|nr:hypothetical protein VCSRO158_1889 [Vibrio cholerae]